MQRVWSVYLEQDREGSSPTRSSAEYPYPSRDSAWDAPSIYSDVDSIHQNLETSSSTVGSSTLHHANVQAPNTFTNRFSYFRNNNNKNLPLSLNYFPTKFSGAIVSSKASGARFRGGKPPPPPASSAGHGPKGDQALWISGSEKLRWNKFKWILFFTNSLLTIYSLTAIVASLLTWFDIWTHAALIQTGNRPELILSTLAASFGILTCITGWAGILLNNRTFLAWYTFFAWISFAFVVSPGYVTYKKHTFNLEGKINTQWSRKLGAAARLKIQDQLGCCGYYSPFVEATVSSSCYSRSVLPGCKARYMRFEKEVLGIWWRLVFWVMVPMQGVVMVAGLICANHVTFGFGKGMMPEAYRLDMGVMGVVLDGYARHLVELYGQEVAERIMGRTRAILKRSVYNKIPR